MQGVPWWIYIEKHVTPTNPAHWVENFTFLFCGIRLIMDLTNILQWFWALYEWHGIRRWDNKDDVRESEKLKKMEAKEKLLIVTSPAGVGKITARCLTICFEFCKSMEIIMGDTAFLFEAVTWSHIIWMSDFAHCCLSELTVTKSFTWHASHLGANLNTDYSWCLCFYLWPKD